MRDTKPRAQSAAAAVGTKPVSMRIVDRIASRLACDPVEIEPLANSIDPEALDDIVESSASTQVSFEHAGFTVEVASNGDETSIDVTRPVQFLD